MSAFRVRITHEVCEQLVDVRLPDYLSPPQPQAQARALAAALLERPIGDHPGPAWRRPTAGGSWRVEILKEHP